VTNTFRNGTALVEQVTGKLPGMVAGLVGKFSRGALTVGTGILAGFMISARLPLIKRKVRAMLPKRWKQEILPALSRVRHTFSRWLLAQLKLMGITWLIVSAGFLLLGVRWGILWAGAVALVDAVPVLGTGTVLVPWALVSFLQGDTLRGLGLLAIFGASWLARSVLEPRLVGKSLGLDPLLSLAAFYAGFRLWGIPGMILAPVSAALIKGLLESGKPFTNNS
jgi:sporulation integral membrane protein YtvI